MTEATKVTEPLFPPPPPGLPKPPAWGWVCYPGRLTSQEAEQIREVAGLDIQADFETRPLRCGAYVAVAYARRVDPEAYPWSVADLLSMEDLDAFFPGQQFADDQEQEQLTAARDQAMENGELPLDPA